MPSTTQRLLVSDFLFIIERSELHRPQPLAVSTCGRSRASASSARSCRRYGIAWWCLPASRTVEFLCSSPPPRLGTMTFSTTRSCRRKCAPESPVLAHNRLEVLHRARGVELGGVALVHEVMGLPSTENSWTCGLPATMGESTSVSKSGATYRCAPARARSRSSTRATPAAGRASLHAGGRRRRRGHEGRRPVDQGVALLHQLVRTDISCA